jgi:acetyltransferase-like isoleucine patch superfamily enzyme
MLTRTLKDAMDERGWSGPAGWVRVLYLYLFQAWFWNVCALLAPDNLTPFFHRLRGVKIGKDVYIHRTAILDGIYPGLIEIGDDVRLTPGCIVYCHVKAGEFLRKELVPQVVAGVKIEESAFIGLGSILLPGVTVGRASVVVSGSVVYRNVPAGCIVSGNPAKVIKRLALEPEVE